MKTKMTDRKRVILGIVLLLAGAIFIPSAKGVDVCGEAFVWIQDEADPVDIDCAAGQTYVLNSTVNLLAGSHISDEVGGGTGSGFITAYDLSIVNVYNGVIDTRLEVSSTATVTIYASSVDPISGLFEDGMTEIVNSGGATIYFTLTGAYQDGTAFTIPVGLAPSAKIYLNIPQQAPEIEVLPALLEYDFGDVPMGETVTYVAHISNVGNADLTVTALGLDANGSTDFSITSAPDVPFIVSPSESIVVDIEITYTPTIAGYASTALIIGSDDEDEPVVEVALGGVGIVVEIPPLEQIQAILDFIDASVEDGTLIPYGPGNLPAHRLCALKNMIRAAGTLIDAGYPEWAIFILEAVDRKTDGKKWPPDFVVGEATATLNQMVNDLIDDLML